MITTKFFHNHDQLSETVVEGAKHGSVSPVGLTGFCRAQRYLVPSVRARRPQVWASPAAGL